MQDHHRHTQPKSTKTRLIVPFSGNKGRGFSFAISIEDAIAILKHAPWYLGNYGINGNYRDEDTGKRGVEYVHRFIFSQYNELLPGHCVDHIDGDIFNNCRENLLQITRRDMKKKRKEAGAKGGIRYSPIAGWYFIAEAHRKWTPYMEIGGVYEYLKDAETAYNAWQLGFVKVEEWQDKYKAVGLRRKKHNLTHAESIGWNLADYQLRQELTTTTPT